jgi:hypothetical protein
MVGEIGGEGGGPEGKSRVAFGQADESFRLSYALSQTCVASKSYVPPRKVARPQVAQRKDESKAWDGKIA